MLMYNVVVVVDADGSCYCCFCFQDLNNANKPNWDSIWQHSTHTLINASGLMVGLPQGQMGNSEVGHINIGSGRIVYQELTRIDEAIKDKSFFDNHV